MKERRAAKRVISNLKEIGFVELAIFTLSFSFHPNLVVAERLPLPPPRPFLLTVFTRISVAFTGKSL